MLPRPPLRRYLVSTHSASHTSVLLSLPSLARSYLFPNIESRAHFLQDAIADAHRRKWGTLLWESLLTPLPWWPSRCVSIVTSVLAFERGCVFLCLPGRERTPRGTASPRWVCGEAFTQSSSSSFCLPTPPGSVLASTATPCLLLLKEN